MKTLKAFTSKELLAAVLTVAAITILILVLSLQRTNDNIQILEDAPADRAAALKHAEETVDQPFPPSLAAEIAEAASNK